MRFDLSVTIGYKSIFDDFEKVDVVQFIKDIPTQNSLELICYFISQIHFNERDESLQFELLRILSARFPKEVNERIGKFINRTYARRTSSFNLINNVSALILIENIIENHNHLEKVSELTAEQELNFFKAYLYCTQTWLDDQITSYRGQKIDSVEAFLNVILPAQLPYTELLEFKDFISQSIKSIYFFKFCEANPIFQDYLDLFLGKYKLKSWQVYLSNLLNLYVRKYERLKVPSVLFVDDSHPDMINFLFHLSIDIDNFNRNEDFLGIRDRPVLKIDKGKFLYLNLNFLIDKIYQGIQFDFASILIEKKAKFKKQPITNFPDFKSIYASEFSESGLFFKIMDYIFESFTYKKLNGNELSKFLNGGGPDYYLRDKSKVYLFEYKDIWLSSTIKHSFDFNKIKSELFIKLVENEVGSPKGIKQLLNAIIRIRDNGLASNDNFNCSKATYYPILVYADPCLNNPGINYILNDKFRELITTMRIKDSHLIKDLVLIDIDTLIKYQDNFHDNELRLNNCLNDFYNFKNDKSDVYNQMGTFNYFLNFKARHLSNNVPRIIKTEIPKLYSNN